MLYKLEETFDTHCMGDVANKFKGLIAAPYQIFSGCVIATAIIDGGYGPEFLKNILISLYISARCP